MTLEDTEVSWKSRIVLYHPSLEQVSVLSATAADPVCAQLTLASTLGAIRFMHFDKRAAMWCPQHSPMRSNPTALRILHPPFHCSLSQPRQPLVSPFAVSGMLWVWITARCCVPWALCSWGPPCPWMTWKAHFLLQWVAFCCAAVIQAVYAFTDSRASWWLFQDFEFLSSSTLDHGMGRDWINGIDSNHRLQDMCLDLVQMSILSVKNAHWISKLLCKRSWVISYVIMYGDDSALDISN